MTAPGRSFSASSALPNLVRKSGLLDRSRLPLSTQGLRATLAAASRRRNQVTVARPAAAPCRIAFAVSRAAKHVACAAALVALASCGGESTAPPAAGGGGTGASCTSGGSAATTTISSLNARLIASGLRNPLDLQSVAGDHERLYVVEQAGRIRVIRNGALQQAAFLDISDRVSSGGERGLLGLAFHPQFAGNRRFFVNYTDRNGDTHIAEFQARDADGAEAASERLLLFVQQPFANHNGGGARLRPGQPPLCRPRRRRLGRRPVPQRPAARHAARQAAASRRRRRSAVRRPRGQSVPRHGRCASGDLGLRPAQPLPLRVRPRERRPLHRRRRAERTRGGRRRPGEPPRRRELRLERDGGLGLLLAGERLRP